MWSEPHAREELPQQPVVRLVELRRMCLAVPLCPDCWSTSDERWARTRTGTRRGDVVAVADRQKRDQRDKVVRTIQREAQARSSYTGGKHSTGTTTKNKEKASAARSGPSYQGGAGAKTRSTSEAAAASKGSHGDEETSAATDRWEILVGGVDEKSAATDRWEILVRRLFHTAAV